ncbi:MAG: hypothetical protein Q4D24_11830 [Erysipelotrichaceae bacterium]|nr:hypothetical protein [Erysipelotrichaceae bacterium]
MKKIVILLIVFLLLGLGAKSLFWKQKTPEAGSELEVSTPELEIPIEDDETAQGENGNSITTDSEKTQNQQGSSQNANTTITEQTAVEPVQTVDDEQEETAPSETETSDEPEETPSSSEEVHINDNGDIELPEIP